MGPPGGVSLPGHAAKDSNAMAKSHSTDKTASKPTEGSSWLKRDRTTGQFRDQKSDRQFTKRMPPRGPSNLIVRSSNPLPLPKDIDSQ